MPGVSGRACNARPRTHPHASRSTHDLHGSRGSPQQPRWAERAPAEPRPQDLLPELSGQDSPHPSPVDGQGRFPEGLLLLVHGLLARRGDQVEGSSPTGAVSERGQGGGGGGREPLQAGSPQPTQGRGQVAGRQRSESRPAPSPAQVAPPWGLGSLQPALPFQPAGSLSAVLMVDFAAFLRSVRQTCRVWSSPHTPTTHWERWRWAARRPRPRCVGVWGTSAPCLKRGGRHGRTRGRRPSPPRARDLDGDGRGGVCVWGVPPRRATAAAPRL